MDALTKISRVFDNVKQVVKEKNSSTRLQSLKKDILLIQSELLVLGKENHGLHIRSLAMEGYLALLSAKIMPLSLSEKKNILTVAFEKLKQHAQCEETLFVFLRIQNLLCYFLIQLDEINRAKYILENVEEMYDDISNSKAHMFIDAEDLFVPEPVSNIKRMSSEKIDKLITNNVQMLAFLYNKLNLPQKYTLYSHTALRRQLEMKEGTPQEWAMRTARLGNYFSYLNQLGNARHHLCAAYHILRTCHDNCKLIPEEFVLQKADFEMHFLELSHHWVKYGLTLFKLSRKKILNSVFSGPSGASATDLWNTVDFVNESLVDTDNNSQKENSKDSGSEKYEKGDCLTEKVYIFPSLDLTDIERKVPLEIITNSIEARKLFSFTHKWLKRAEHYYDFEHHSSHYISCSLQLAELYEHLAFFEKNIDNQYTVQKRRADVLETLNSLLKNCDNVMSIQIDVIKELSQVQLELMALNLQKLWREESQTNILNVDNDTDSIIHSLNSESNKTLTEKTLNTSSKNIFLRKMEATTSINGKLFRLSGQIDPGTPSELSFDYGILGN
ncbi:KIF-binding protein-like [Bicyclus anynana]|uniref:KIF-binding protein n=1 Tax=Bicyclus anynana TaxID=110368 RepID=A0A6J1N4W0_BICAN|nr:KIF-binding protein-like [Bicyclus anynana]